MDRLAKWWDAAAQRPRIVVDDLRRWTVTEGRRHRLYISGARRVIASQTPSPVVCDPQHAAPDGRDLAREWLRWLFHEQRRRTGRRPDRRIPVRTRDLRFLDIPHPLHYAGVAELPDAALVDITACYHSLYRRLPLDLSYDPGRAWGLGRFWWLAADEIAAEKFARNVALGITRARRFIVWEYGQPAEISPWTNRYLSPGLWGAIVDILHTIAGEAVSRGAVHWHTDGGIMPAEAAEPFRQWLEEMWGLDSTVTYGHAQISGIGAWRLGDQIRRTWRPTPRPPRSNLRTDLPAPAWLAANLARSAREAPTP